jgi:large subunit ribosomal protein L4
MPKKQRRLARDSAVLAKLLNNNVVVINELSFEKPRTSDFVSVLDNLKISDKGSCLVTISSIDANLYKSARNIPKVAVMPVAELNAGDICNHSKILFTKEAFVSYLANREAKSENGRL